MLNNPYSLNKNKKKILLKKNIIESIKFHKKKCAIYSDYLNKFSLLTKPIKSLDDIPFIPVSAFKEFDLLSVDKDKVFKTIVSSGTSSNSPSKIYLDKKNSLDQIKALYSIGSFDLGNKRLPMMIVDNEDTIKDSNHYSARTAGTLGFSIFSSNRTFVLNKQMNINNKSLTNFLKTNKNNKFIIFGFTYLIWIFFNNLLNTKYVNYFHNATIIHGGGWKKLYKLNISNEKFTELIVEKFKIKKTINYYGMVEQTGSIFMECDNGFFHTSDYNDIIIRNKNLNISKHKEEGIVQLISSIPSSYPGNSILTEDLGYIQGEDQCKCGKNGKIFKITGRIEKSIVRGCSDVF